MEPQSDKKRLGELVVNYFRDFKVLKETRSEYWGIQAINFLDCTVFFSVMTIAVILLSEDFGFSDENAGYIYAFFATATTICLFFFGTVTDWLGIRKALYVAMIGQGITRGAVLAAALMPNLPHRGKIVAIAFFLMAPFVAMVQTTFQAANKRFTTKNSRGAGFNLWYLFMNIGAAAAGFLIDIVRISLGLPNAHIFSFGVFAAVACMVVTFLFVRREDQLYSDDEQPETEPSGKTPRRNPFAIVAAVVVESAFWRFIALCALLVGVRAVFLYLHILWPKYWLRVIGPEAKIGTLQAVNPILVIIGLILLIPVLHRFNVFKMLVYGAMISAVSLFIMAIPTVGDATYWVAIAGLIILTIGEVVWSPRLQEYTAAIAPEGQEGTYLGLSMVPYFLAKTVITFASGHMLTHWCPEGVRPELEAGTREFFWTPSMLWILLGGFALIGPIVGLTFQKWFTKGARWKREEPTPAAADATPATASGAATRECPFCSHHNAGDADFCAQCGKPV